MMANSYPKWSLDCLVNMKKFFEHIRRFFKSIWRDIDPGWGNIQETLSNIFAVVVFACIFSSIVVGIAMSNIWFFNLFGCGLDYQSDDFSVGMSLTIIEFIIGALLCYLIGKWRETAERSK